MVVRILEQQPRKVQASCKDDTHARRSSLAAWSPAAQKYRLLGFNSEVMPQNPQKEPLFYIPSGSRSPVSCSIRNDVESRVYCAWDSSGFRANSRF